MLASVVFVCVCVCVFVRGCEFERFHVMFVIIVLCVETAVIAFVATLLNTRFIY